MTNHIDQSLLLRLSEVGLNDNDSKVYIYLLQLGQIIGGSKIALQLGMHRQYIHTSLQKLIKLELVEEIPSGARNKYRALPPAHLERLAKSHLHNIQRVVRELNAISAIGAEQDFEIYRGINQVVEFEEELVHSLPPNTEQYIIGGGSKAFITFFGDRFEEITGDAATKGLKTMYVGAPDELPWLERAQKANKLFEYKIIETMPTTIVQMVIRLDSVTFCSYATPPLVYVVKSKAVYEDYRKFFDMLWNMAM
ncbi:MAG: transcriptional regulator TrmB [Candidatus Kaiserbacteria bacterium]|nr:transcriptional regulator TrmB [Candidatus Kaiserbacteria bacterium]